ncbi:MAG: GDSL-like Lipase/Acylhydrolase [Methanomassiliicoccales archaeon PtaB.Bin215]|nr:MAG: GDSL-like Lipase/Acylhydrolase [Methanomassiliicoccales archaeon PtaB.Bin215]
MVTVVCIGDSLTGGSGASTDYKYPSRLGGYIGGVVVNKGTTSDKTSEILARFATDVVSYSPSKVFIWGGTNDIIHDVEMATIKANLTAMLALASAAGVKVYLLNTIPRNSFTEAQNTALETLNAWIAGQASGGVVAVDVWTPIKDPLDSTQIAAAYDSGDGTHLNGDGYLKIVQAVVSAGVTAGDWTINTWTNTGGDGKWSTDANWSLEHTPTATETAVFDGTSTANCAVDETVDVYGINLAMGYTGTVTHGAVDIGIGAGGFAMAAGTAGTATFNVAKTVTCAGSFIHAAGTITADKLKIINTGSSSAYSLADARFASLINNGTITLSTNLSTRSVVNNGAFSIAATKYLEVMLATVNYPTAVFTNTGVFTGAGSLKVYGYAAAHSIALGRIFCPLYLYARSLASESVVFTPSDNGEIYAPLSVSSDHASYTCTLDAAGKSLVLAGNVTVGTRGVILGGEGVHHFAGAIDSSAGSWDPETCTVVKTGTGTVKLAAGQEFNNLEAPVEPLNLASDVTITGRYRHLRDAILNGFTLTFDPAQEIKMQDPKPYLPGRAWARGG